MFLLLEKRRKFYNLVYYSNDLLALKKKKKLLRKDYCQLCLRRYNCQHFYKLICQEKRET